MFFNTPSKNNIQTEEQKRSSSIPISQTTSSGRWWFFENNSYRKRRFKRFGFFNFQNNLPFTSLRKFIFLLLCMNLLVIFALTLSFVVKNFFPILRSRPNYN